MSDIRQLRNSALDIFNTALRSVDAYSLTRRAIVSNQNQIRIANQELDETGPIYVIAIGKAAALMSRALNETLSHRIKGALLTCQDTSIELPQIWQKFKVGHPLPNEGSVAAAHAATRLAAEANLDKAPVICAVSGGGSAMFEAPVDETISLTDLREANRLLISCGGTIAEVNTVRRSFSAVKGGKLCSFAPNSQFITLIISDTNPGDEANVASGPTITFPGNGETAAMIVQRYQLEPELPKSILRAIRNEDEVTDLQHSNTSHFVVADNDTAIQAAARRAKELGFRPVISEVSEQPISEGCELLVEQLKTEPAPVCLISGGELSCSVQGNGVGGRNCETVLRTSIATDVLTDHEDHVVVLSAGTDGIDGNSPAAGAIADETTMSRARSIGLEPSEFLAQSNSYGFFERLGDAIVTGPTGTNVRDLRIFLKADRQE